MTRAIDGLVSVIIPVHNGRPHLRSAIDSVLAQTHRPLEIIAVDDGSTDGSGELIRQYGEAVTLFAQSNRGVGHARNAGIERARGEFIAFLDQDDWWQPEKLARQVELFRRDAAIGLVHTEVRYFDEPTQSFTSPLNPDATPDQLVGACYEALLLENHVRNSSVVLRTSAVAAAGTCSPEICGNTVQDYDLWLRVARVCHFGYVNEALTVIRLHAGQGTWDRRQMLVEEARLLERVAVQELNTPAMRRRMARLYDALGVARLDAHDARGAREAFRHSLRYAHSWRGQALLAATYVPESLVDRARRLRSALWNQRASTSHLGRFAGRKLEATGNAGAE